MKFLKQRGFTLLEMILVLAIMSTLIVMILGYTTRKADEIRRDKMVLQMQQILNAGLAFYVNNGIWPVKGDFDGDCSTYGSTLTLLTDFKDKYGQYLPANFKSPYQESYSVACDAQTGSFMVRGGTSSNVEAQIIAGRLPVAQVMQTNAKVVEASVMIPGQNLNNARGLNFANLYHNGGCAPAPKCPTNMKPQIFVVPVSVSGVNDSGSQNVYPISSFTAYAKGDVNGRPIQGGKGISGCYNNTALDCRFPDEMDPNTSYWRVCLQVITEKGNVNANNSQWGQNVTVMAVTRCVPVDSSGNPSEPAGSSFSVWER